MNSRQNYPFGPGQGYTGVSAKTASYAPVAADNGLVFTFNGSSLTATLPASAPPKVWFAVFINLHSTALTINPNGLTLNGSGTSITVAHNTAVTIWSDGTNYEYAAGGGSGSGGSTWYVGTVDPSALHNDGDFYLNTVTGSLFEQVSGSWGSPVAYLMVAAVKVGGRAAASDKQMFINGVTDGATLWTVSINGTGDGG